MRCEEPGRVEMAGEDLGLADRLVRQEAIGGLGVGPVLACQRDGRTDRVRQLHEKLAQPPAQTFVLERRAGEFLVYPGGGIPARMIHRAPGLYLSVLDNASRPGSFGASLRLHPADVGNCKRLSPT